MGTVCRAAFHQFWLSLSTCRVPHTAGLTARCLGCPWATASTPPSLQSLCDGHNSQARPAWPDSLLMPSMAPNPSWCVCCCCCPCRAISSGVLWMRRLHSWHAAVAVSNRNL